MEIFETSPGAKGRYKPLAKGELLARGERGVRLGAGQATVEISALAPDLFRVGMFPEGRTPDYASEAIAKEDWEPLAEPVKVSGEAEIDLSTRAATAHISLDPVRVSFSDLSGRVFAADDEELGMGVVELPTGADVFSALLGNPVRLYKKREEGERYFGCGERTSSLEKTGSYQVFWNVDPPPGHTASFNNLYSSIPFVLSMRGGVAYGLFFDNTHRVEFDLAHEREDLAYYGAEGGDVVYYVFCGPTPRDVLRRYTELTGRTPMPPLWSLGNQQCRYSYDTADELRGIARNFRERGIPCDTLYLDIDYMDGYRVFTWDRERFPEPEKLIAELKDQGFNLVTIVDPGVKVDENYPVYTEGRERDLYCKTSESEEYHNVVWPGLCAFPDFTNPETREWWGENHRALLDAGVAGIWCDMNEPSLFVPKQSTMPDEVVHPGGGRPRLHAQIHNTYGSLMVRAVREGLLKIRPDERPFVITRAGYAGLQRHALQWTGDNSSWWEHVWMSMPQLMNMGLSGVAWAGVDVGGFFDDCDGELLARFTEFGVFQTFYRNHSIKGSRHQEPWVFGEPYESVCREMIRLRQRLLPYLYTLFEECHRTGAPILRPLLFEYPDDETTYTADDEFLLGDALLVAPITRPGRANEHRHVYLPEGTWCHFWTNERIEGPAHVLAHAPLGEPAIYAHANTAIPLWPEMNHVGERAADPLTLLVYPAADAAPGEATLYEDAGDGFAYRDGEYARRKIRCEASSGGLWVRLGGREGSFVPERGSINLELRGMQTRPAEVSADGEGSDWDYEEEAGRLVIRLAEDAGETVVEVRL